MKKILLTICICTSLFIYTGCNSGKNQPPPSTTPTEQTDSQGRDSGEPMIEIVGSGEGSEEPSEESTEINPSNQNTADIAIENSFLGVSYVVPAGWWVNKMFPENINPNPEVTSTEDKLNIFEVTDEVSGMEFFDISSLKQSDLAVEDYKDSLSLYVYVDKFNTAGTFEDYLKYFREKVFISDTIKTVRDEEVTVGGVKFHELFISVEEEAPFEMRIFLQEKKDNYFIINVFTNFIENVNANEQVLDYLTNNFKSN